VEYAVLISLSQWLIYYSKNQYHKWLYNRFLLSEKRAEVQLIPHPTIFHITSLFQSFHKELSEMNNSSWENEN